MSTIARERIAELANFKPSGANSVNSASREEWQELARIALASLEAEAVAMRWRYLPDGIHGMGEWNYRDQGYIDTLNAYHLSRQKELLYTAPPAPVSVPECFKRLLHHAYGMTMGNDWNKGTMAGHHRDKLCRAVEDCRAAMLQGADGKSPAGWVACSERMPEEGSKVIVFRPRADESNDPPVKTATYKGGREYYHGFDCYCEPTHWMPLPAAPQQEVKS